MQKRRQRRRASSGVSLSSRIFAPHAEHLRGACARKDVALSEMATAATSGTLPSLSLLPWLLLAVIAGAGIQPLLAGKREEALGKLQCESQLSEARGKLVFLERSSETDAQRIRQLQEELAAVKQSEQQLRREAEMRRNATPEQTLPEQLRALMEMQHLLTNVPQARLKD